MITKEINSEKKKNDFKINQKEVQFPKQTY